MGITMFQLAYISLQYFQLKKIEYLYYLGYIFTICLYVFIKYDASLELNFITAFYPKAELHLDRCLPLFGYFLYYRFARYFADIEKLNPRLSGLIKKMELLVLGYVAFELCWEIAELNRNISEYVFWTISALLFITTICFGIILFAKRTAMVNYLIAGAIALNLGSMGTVLLMHFNTNNYMNIDVLLPLNIGFVIELLAFTTGLSHKAKFIEIERSKMQQDLLLQAKKNLDLELRLNNMRNEIASDFHNDLSASLSAISIYSSLLKKKIRESPDQLELIGNKISESAERINNTVLDLVWALNPKNQHLSDIILKCEQFAKEELEPVGINFSIRSFSNEMLLHTQGLKLLFSTLKTAIRMTANNFKPNEVAVLLNHQQATLTVEIHIKGIVSKSTDTDYNFEQALRKHIQSLDKQSVITFDTTQQIIFIHMPITSISDTQI